MKLKTNVPEFYNDISESVRAFEEVPAIELADENPDLTVWEEEDGTSVTATAQAKGERETVSASLEGDELEQKRARRHAAKRATYFLYKRLTGQKLPWGSLTGIRPTKLWREVGENALADDYDLPEDKRQLLKTIVTVQQPFFTPEKDEIDIYVGIPFCRTRCSYCSFSTTDATKGEKLMIPYVEALNREIVRTRALVDRLHKRVRCTYIGGGTPTALTEELFDQMLTCASENFKPEREFTVEAGRPDTITEAKLARMKACGVTRISINPQSMNPETLALVGRSHSPEEIEQCFALARRVGFDRINADLIAGLPGETPEKFFYSLDRVLALGAENITVHTLALKRGSILAEKKYRPVNATDVQTMVEGARETLTRRGYVPYYLYRQKYMTGNFENIGYARPGTECVYNIDIMEETTDILALGCGGVSKRLFPGERLERAFNYKNIYQYNAGVTEAVRRKALLFGLAAEEPFDKENQTGV